jgi:hypothetical protein
MKHEWMRDEKWMDDMIVKIDVTWCVIFVSIIMSTLVVMCNWVNTNIDQVFPQ